MCYSNVLIQLSACDVLMFCEKYWGVIGVYSFPYLVTFCYDWSDMTSLRDIFPPAGVLIILL